jgi:TRAP-type mannitol/chloroaromatic compound transport system permease large subunit
VFEPVMVAYYVWPALAVALVAASGTWTRLIPTSLAAVIVTFASGAGWQGPWTWWGSMVAGLGLTLLAARIP